MPVGSGPFMVTEFTPARRSSFKKNPNFFIGRPPQLDEIIWRTFRTVAMVIAIWRTGEADSIRFWPQSDIRRLENGRELTHHQWAMQGSADQLAAFNTASPK